MSEDFQPRTSSRARVGLGLRLLLLLSGVAAFSTGLALSLQDQALSSDLRRAALGRADRAAASVELLVESHLGATTERFSAISRTPALRATLEVHDAPTLNFYAESLRSREGASSIAFIDRTGAVSASAGDAALVEQSTTASEPHLFSVDEHAYAVVSIPLVTDGAVIGRLVAVELIASSLLETWAELSSADVSFVPRSRERSDAVVRVVRSLGDLDLEVAVSLRDEQIALSHSRQNLLVAGGVALALAFFVSVGVSGSITRPIRAIQSAAGRIGEGEFGTRIDINRSDEIGDVARAVDDMGDRLANYRSQVEAQTSQLERSITDLEASRGQLANAQRLAQMGSWELDSQSGEIHGSDEFRSLFGLQPDPKPIDPAWLLESVHTDDRDEVRRAVVACLEGAAALRIDCRVVRADLPERVMHIQARVQLEQAAPGQRLEGTIQDVTERRRAEEQIRYLNHYDPLTGLGNRSLFHERLEIQLKQARRIGARVGVFHLDVDRFKRINDTFGPSMGDQLLKDVADRLVETLRSTDSAGRQSAENAISRLGGDEFTLVLRQADSGPDFTIVARRLIDAVSRPFKVGEHDVVVGASVGISVFPDDGNEVEDLVQNAASALNHAKGQGGQGVQFYAGSMNEEALRRLMLENELRRALDRDEFELHYQPKVCLATARVMGAEALVRWRNADGQLISPGLFIPIAEETGLIGQIGDWVTRTACHQIAAWAEAGLAVSVSVNLSIHQFSHADIADRIRSILRETGAPPALLELEITESTLMQDERDVVSALESLREIGVRVSLDDFGTGYSSFAHLRSLPVDTIKIDRSFVIDVAESESDAALAASIVSMGRALGLDVIAEGVETEAQRDVLARAGCDEMQGFLVSQAVEADAFRDIVRKRGWGRRDSRKSETL